ncbi:MAG TPA: PKD domain-containing protein [Chryseolinea sp.]|nr:PKD domain-containing protein [Chryseolinea sp.]
MFRNYSVLFLLFWLLSSGFAAQAGPSPEYLFIENKNQWPAPIQYAVGVPGGKMFLQTGGFTYYFLDKGRLQTLHDHTADSNVSEGQAIGPDEMIDAFGMRVDFVASNKATQPIAFGRSQVYYNFFLGKDSCKWASDAHGYQGLLYPSLYEGIDLKVYSSDNNLKYDLVVAPQADPTLIKISYAGARGMFIDASGDMQVDASIVQIIEKKPVAFQYIDGKKIYVPCTYRLADSQVSFLFPEGYDPCYELVIDPLLIFSTYSGSTADNWGSTATPGEHGNLYSAGVTNENAFGGDFPATNGAFQVSYGGVYDVGILKYDSSGANLLYATFLGGDETESAHSMVVNDVGELIVLGTTSSANFPTSPLAYDRFFAGGTTVNAVVVPYANGSDIYVARINQAGTKLIASTFLGGSANDGLNPLYGPLSKNYGDQLRGDVITDGNHNIYISTVTASEDFPIVNGINSTYGGGLTDAIIAKLDPNLSNILWSTYIGGSGEDASHTVKFDKAENLFIGGGTTSPDFPTTVGAYQTILAGDADGWIASMKSDGSEIYNATLTGTSTFDQIYFIDLNANDEVYAYGQTDGNFPVTLGVYSNPNSGQFIQKFDHDLSKLIFSTVIGSGRGIPDISPTAFLVNDCNNIYLTGWGGIVNSETFHWPNNTVGMPVSTDAFQKTTSGSDFYFMVLTDDATEFLYGTYMGGTQSRTHVDGGTSRFDKGGIVYHAVCSGCRAFNATRRPTSDFPTTDGVWSNSNGSPNCNNAAFKFDLSSLKARLQSNSIKLDEPGLSKICIPDPIVFQNLSTGGETFEWDLGDGTKLVKPDTAMITHQYAASGRYIITLKAIDKGTCKVTDSAFVRVDVFIAQVMVQDDDDVCLNASYTLHASGGAKYDWVSEDGEFHSALANPAVAPADTMRYFVTVTEFTGCLQKDTVTLNVIPVIRPEFEIDQSAECFERPTLQVRSTTDSLKTGDRLFFDFGDGTTSDNVETSHEFDKDGLYGVKLVGVREFCVTEKIMPTPVFKLLIPNVITPGQKDNSNDKFSIQYGDVVGVTPRTYGFKTGVIIYNRWGSKVYGSDDYQYDWDGEGLAGGIYYYEVTVEGHATCKSWLHLVK